MTRDLAWLAVVGCACALFAATATADFKDDIGYTKLHSALGASTPDGSGVTVADVETGFAYPDTLNGTEFSNLQFEYPTLDVPVQEQDQSEHDTVVLRFFIGNITSIAPGVPTVLEYSDAVDHEGWNFAPYPVGGASYGHANSILKQQGPQSDTISGGALPGYSAARVTSTATNASATSAFVRRLDWYIATDDTIYISAGIAFYGAGAAIAYNAIIAGVSTGNNIRENTFFSGWQNPSESIYNQGQHPWPTLVATNVSADVPDVSVSSASFVSAVVSSAAVLLVQTGHDDADLSTDPVVQHSTNRAGLAIRNAERSEVIKAAMMAGADRTARHTEAGAQKYLLQESSGWSNNWGYRQFSSDRSDNGLDKRMGAGQLNVYNSYYIIASGEQNSDEDGGGQNGVPGSGTSARGFDYDPNFGGLNSSNQKATYLLPVRTTPQLLTASLVWNIKVVGDTVANPGVFDGTTTLYDLALSLIDITNPNAPVVVTASDSAIENTENLWIDLQANHAYALQVSRGHSAPAFDWDYGLAWQMLQDIDADGAADDNDNCIDVANGPLAPGNAGQIAQWDTNGDGYGNICDADINNSGQVTTVDYTILRNHLNQNFPDADLNGSGVVTTSDYQRLRLMLNHPPGPSAYAP